MTDEGSDNEATQEQRERLAAAVKLTIRLSRGRCTDKKIAERGGPSNTTMTNIRRVKGPTPSPRTLAHLDAGLEWVEGSAYGVLWEGKQPTPKEEDKSRNGGSSLAPVVELTRGPLGQLLKIRREIDLVIEQLRALE